MNNPIQNRLSEYLKCKSLTNKDFEDICGLSNGAAAKLSEKSRKTTFNRLVERTDLNVDWLLTGEGEMLKPFSLKSHEIDEGMNPMDENFSNSYLVPLVPMSAMGGELVDFEANGVRPEDCEKVISPIAGASFAIPIYGDSMEPEYPNGSRVFVKQINPHDFIAWGNAFVLDTTNGIILKVVVESENPDAVRCVSLNPSGRYQPFDVPKRTIRGMYRVLACVTAKG